MKNRRFSLILLALVSILSIVFAGLAGAAGRGVTKDTIKLGLVLVKTGPVAALGLPNGQGMVDYMNYLNEKGGINGRKVEVIWEDELIEIVPAE